MANTLARNGDGSPNFGVKLLTSNGVHVSTGVLHEAIVDLFKADAEIALLFFAGHGVINTETNAGYLVSQDGQKPSWGISLSDVIDLANKAYPRIKSTVIILDSCQSGYAGEIQGISGSASALIGNGVTILTACHRDGFASESGGHGLFTGLLLDGLSGSAADVCGRITPAGLYSLIDQTLGEWEQRPVYKANVQHFVVLRSVAPKVPLEVLRRLPDYFPDPGYEFPLDPSHEPDRNSLSPEQKISFPEDEDKQRLFKELQMCNRHGLVAPVHADHMFFAAIEEKSCKLTALGAHYRNLAVLKRI
ncbi:MAG: caspase family protein [Bosea sp.]|nr:caspase family protein [Bosea sp. (in: a-proteobacteria)]